jgi:hypothetical protein
VVITHLFHPHLVRGIPHQFACSISQYRG